jgi:hypothetical protein
MSANRDQPLTDRRNGAVWAIVIGAAIVVVVVVVVLHLTGVVGADAH